MSILDLKTDFYRPLWIRLLLLFIMFGWAAVEFLTGAPFWGVVFGGVGAVALWQWFFSGWPGIDTPKVNSSTPDTVDRDSGET